jgi:hypothetical protein
VFVTPLRGDREIAAAAQVGFNVAHTLHSVRVMGPDRPGVAAELTEKLADGGINLGGFSLSPLLEDSISPTRRWTRWRMRTR